MRHWVLLVYAFRGSPNLHGGLFYEPEKETRPFPNQLENGNTSTGRAYLTMKKLNHTRNGLKVILQRLRNPIKKRSALRIQAESVEETPKKGGVGLNSAYDVEGFTGLP